MPADRCLRKVENDAAEHCVNLDHVRVGVQIVTSSAFEVGCTQAAYAGQRYTWVPHRTYAWIPDSNLIGSIRWDRDRIDRAMVGHAVDRIGHRSVAEIGEELRADELPHCHTAVS